MLLSTAWFLRHVNALWVLHLVLITSSQFTYIVSATQDFVIVDGDAGKIIFPNNDTVTGALSRAIVHLHNHKWEAPRIIFNISADVFDSYNTPTTTFLFKGHSQIEFIINGDFSFDMQFHLDGTATSDNSTDGFFLGGFVGSRTCCLSGSGPSGGFLFHGAGHVHPGAAARGMYGRSYYNTTKDNLQDIGGLIDLVTLGGSTGARINEVNPGTGGGVFVLTVHGSLSFGLNSAITVNGYNITNTDYAVCPGGSSAGLIYIKANKISGFGYLSANGGASSSKYVANKNMYCGDGGSGGFILLNAPLEIDIKKFKFNVQPGVGRINGSLGLVQTKTTFTKEIVINTTSCMLTTADFPTLKMYGILNQYNITDNISTMVCELNFYSDVIVKNTTLIHIDGFYALSINTEKSLVFGALLDLRYTSDKQPPTGNTRLGGYHMFLGGARGPGAFHDFAYHGNAKSAESYGYNPFKLAGGSACTDDHLGLAVGGAAVQLMAKEEIRLQEDFKIFADAWTEKNNNVKTCGASGGSIRIQAKTISFESEKIVLSASASPETSNGGHGGVIYLQGCIKIKWNPSLITRFQQKHLKVSGGVLTRVQFDGYTQGIAPSTLTDDSKLKDFSNEPSFCQATSEIGPQVSSTPPEKSVTSLPINSFIHTSTTIPSKRFTTSGQSESSKLSISSTSTSKFTSSASVSLTPEIRNAFQEIIKEEITDDNTESITNKLKVVMTSHGSISSEEEKIVLQVFSELAKKSNVYSSSHQVGQMVQIADNVLETQINESHKKIEHLATYLSESLEEIGRGLTQNLTSHRTIFIRTNRTYFEVASLKKNTTKNYSFPTYCNDKHQCNTIVFPTQFVSNLTDSTTVTSVAMNLSQLSNTDVGPDRIKSLILSIKLNVNVTTTPFEHPLILKQIVENDIQQTNDIRSMYWKQLRLDNQYGGKWSSDGIKIIKQENNIITSMVDHLTSFALLMQVTEISIPKGHKFALQLITYIGCGLSSFGFLLTFGTLVSIQTLSSDRTTIHVNLVAALGIAQIIFLTGIDATNNKTICKFVAVLLHYFFSAAFGWMLAEGLHLYAKVVNVFQDGRSRMKFYYCIGWGTPVILVSISAAIHPSGYGTDQACWISTDNGFIWAFVGPVIFVILANVFVMVSVVKVLMSSVAAPTDATNAKTKEQIRAALKAMAILMPILGGTWILGLFAVNKDNLFFQYFFVIANTFQGVLIFLFYCFFNSEVRSALKRLHEKHNVSKILSKSTLETSANTTDFKIKIKERFKRRVSARHSVDSNSLFAHMTGSTNTLNSTLKEETGC